MDQKLRNGMMLDAVKSGNLDQVTELTGEDQDFLRMMTPFGSWLHVASAAGHINIVKYLVDMGLDVNARGGTFNGNALNLAASNGHIEVVKYLLSCSANIDVSEPERNPIFGAIYGGSKEVVRLLIDSGADIRVRYTGELMHEMDAAAFAKERGQLEIAEMLDSAK